MGEKFGCATTRFVNDTWEENQKWCAKNKYKCAYSSSSPMAASLDDIPYIYIIEMNNETNTIEGIGLVPNKSYANNKVYKNALLNLFTYKSNCKMRRDEFIERNEIETLELLTKLIFKGYCHFKRGSGYTILPNKITYKSGQLTKKKADSPGRTVEIYEINWSQFFTKAFRRHFGEKLNI
jgi:hypothetical protein